MKKRNKYFYKEKELIRLRMKDQELHTAIRNQGLVELEEPIHHGYNADWVLRPDIARRDDAAAYQEALDACKGRIWGKTPDFKHKDKKTKKWVLHNPKMNPIKKVTYDALSPTAKKFYIEDTTRTKKYWKLGFTDIQYRCTLSYELVVVITKSYITHRREHDNVLYQLEAENEKMMYIVAGNDNPWGGNHSSSKWWRSYENKQEKLEAERRIVEVKKAYTGITSKRDLLDI